MGSPAAEVPGGVEGCVGVSEEEIGVADTGFFCGVEGREFFGDPGLGVEFSQAARSVVEADAQHRVREVARGEAGLDGEGALGGEGGKLDGVEGVAGVEGAEREEDAHGVELEVELEGATGTGRGEVVEGVDAGGGHEPLDEAGRRGLGEDVHLVVGAVGTDGVVAGARIVGEGGPGGGGVESERGDIRAGPGRELARDKADPHGRRVYEGGRERSGDDEDLEVTAFGWSGEDGGGFAEGDARGDEGVGIEPAALEGVDAIVDRPEAGAEEFNFAEDGTGEVVGGLRGEGPGEDGAGLEDDTAARADEIERGGEPGGGMGWRPPGVSGAVDDGVLIVAETDVGDVTVSDSPAFAAREAVGMAAEEADVGAGGEEGLGAEQAEDTIAQDGDEATGASEGRGVPGGGDGEGEDGGVVVDAFGDREDIGGRDGEPLGEAPRLGVEAHDASGAALGRDTAAAELAHAADEHGVDDDAGADEGLVGGVGGALDDTDALVARDGTVRGELGSGEVGRGKGEEGSADEDMPGGEIGLGRAGVDDDAGGRGSEGDQGAAPIRKGAG